MNTLDLFLLIPVALGFIFGLLKGLVKELASLAAIVLGIFGAKIFAPFISDILISVFHFSAKTAQPLAYLFLFIAIGIGLLLLAKMLDKFFSAIALGGVNKILGGIFGGLKIALIVSVLLNVFDALDSRFSILSYETKENSIGYNPLMKLGPTLWDKTKEDKTPDNQSKTSDEEKDNDNN